MLIYLAWGDIIIGLSVRGAYENFDLTVVFFVVMCSIGRFMMGRSIEYFSHQKIWPIIRSFINEQAVNEATKNENL